jgi:hypothetical protein
MYRFKVVLVALADRLFACSHSRTSFPITLRTGTQKVETYVVCLECARHFAYDWTAMRITGEPAAAALASGRRDWRDGGHRQPAY